MAQAKPRNLNTIISKFYWWMSQDDYVWAADNSGQPMCFYDGSWVEISQNAKFIEISQNYDASLTTLWTVASLWSVVSLITTWTSDQAICCRTWKILSWDWSTVFTASNNICNSFVANWYWHIIKSSWKIDRWLLASWTTAHDTWITLNTVTADYADIWASMIWNNPYIIDSGYIYICNSNNVYKLDLTTAWYPAVKILTVDIWFTIKAITQIWDRFYIYASDWVMWIQYLWTWSNVTTWWWLTKIRWYDKPIVNVANINNIDYVIVGDNTKRALYVVNWYQPQLLLQSKFIQNSYNDKFVFKPDAVNWIETISNLIFIPADNCIYTYGKINPLLPEACVRKITLNGLAPTCLWTDDYGNYNLYYFYNSWTDVKKVTNYLVKEKYGLDPATIIFNPIISNFYSSKDSALKVRIWYDLPTTDCKINLYFKPDYKWWYANFYVNTNSTTLPVIWDTYTFSWTTYTVYAITSKTANTTNYIVHCTYTATPIDITQINERGTSGTMTRATWTWPATFIFYRRTMWMKLAWTITNINEHKQLFAAEDPCYQMTFMVDLITYNTTYSPRLWDFVYAYQEIENDI